MAQVDTVAQDAVDSPVLVVTAALRDHRARVLMVLAVSPDIVVGVVD